MVVRTGVPPSIASEGICLRLQHLPQLLHRQPLLIRITRVPKIRGEGLPFGPELRDIPDRILRFNHKHSVNFDGMPRLIAGYEHLMELLSRTNSNHLHLALGRDRLLEIHHLHTQNFGNEYLPSAHRTETLEHKLHTLIESKPKPCHAFIRNSDHSCVLLLKKKRDDTPPAAHDIAIAHATKPCATFATVGIPLDKNFLCDEFGGAIEIHRVHSLIGAQGHYLLYSRINSRINNILGTENVGLHRFEGIVLACGNMLEGCSMHDNIDSVHGAIEAITITNIPDEVPQSLIVIPLLLHVVLLEFVTTKDNQTLGVVFFQDFPNESLPKGSGPTRYQNRRVGKVHKNRYRKSKSSK